HDAWSDRGARTGVRVSERIGRGIARGIEAFDDVAIAGPEHSGLTVRLESAFGSEAAGEYPQGVEGRDRHRGQRHPAGYPQVVGVRPATEVLVVVALGHLVEAVD